MSVLQSKGIHRQTLQDSLQTTQLIIPGFWFVSRNLLCSSNGKKTASFITLYLMLLLSTLPWVPHHPGTSEHLLWVRQQQFLHVPYPLTFSEYPFKSLLLNRRPKDQNSQRDDQLLSLWLMVPSSALCQWLHLCEHVTHFLMLSRALAWE